MKAIVRQEVDRAVRYMQIMRGKSFDPLVHLAELAAEDEDGELGRLVTEVAMEALNADHNIVMLAAPHIGMHICKACAADTTNDFRRYFGPWMTEADQKRLAFIHWEVNNQIDEAGGEENCRGTHEDTPTGFLSEFDEYLEEGE